MNDNTNTSILRPAQIIRLKGSTRWVAKNAYGEVVDEKCVDNNILLQIRKPIISLLGAAQTDKAQMPFVNAIGFGTDGTAPSEVQTDLIAPITGAKKLLAAAPQFDADGLGVTFVVLFDLTDAYVDGITLREAVLYTQSTTANPNGIAIARTAIGEYKKLTGLFLEYYHKIRTEIE